MAKSKEVKFRHYVIIKIAKILLRVIIKIKYNYKYKRYKDLKNKKPVIVMGNHTVSVDPILMSLSFPFHLYFFATEQIFNLGLLSKLLLYAVNPIKKTKSLSDMTAIRKAKQIVKEGGSIGIYPEGNVSYDGNNASVNKSIVKLVRLLNIPIVFFVTEGLYFSDPRWSIFRKKGKSKGYIKSILEPSEYETLSDDELYLKIVEGISSNAYQQQEKSEILFKGKNKASGIERLLFMDLNTNKPFVTYSDKSSLKSTDSDFYLEYKENGLLVDKNNVKHTLIDLNEQTKKAYFNFYKDSNGCLYEEKVDLEKTTHNHKEKIGHVKSSLYKDRIVIESSYLNFELLFKDINSLAIQGKKKIIIYTNDSTWLVILDEHSSPYKYLLTYQYYNKGEEIYDGCNDFSKFGL